MSWLRPRKRSVDIVTTTKARDLEQQQHNNGDAVNTGKEGKYISVQRIFVAPAEEEDRAATTKTTTTYMNGLLSSETDGDFDKLQQLQQIDLDTNQKDLEVFDGDKEDKQEDLAFNQNLQEPTNDSSDMIKIEQLDINNSEGVEHTEEENTEIEDEKYSQDKDCHSDHSEELDQNEEERDIYSDENRNIIKYHNKYMGKPRHSLDSQLELLPKREPKISSLDSLNEDEDLNDSRNLDERNNTDVPQKKKSISWASDLETIHEFHKIKGRRLSLSALFKKY